MIEKQEAETLAEVREENRNLRNKISRIDEMQNGGLRSRNQSVNCFITNKVEGENYFH